MLQTVCRGRGSAADAHVITAGVRAAIANRYRGSKPRGMARARKPQLTAKLARTIRTKDGGALRTRGEAADYMTNLPEQRGRYQAWQHAARLLLAVVQFRIAMPDISADALQTELTRLLRLATDAQAAGDLALVRLATDEAAKCLAKLGAAQSAQGDADK